ncbi:MAG: hypothetical protein ACFFDQ_02925 [Candidatus Thorarchaeota archaeon]
MEELEKVQQAQSIVERYDEYLFRKIWGRMLIAIGLVLPLSALVYSSYVALAMESVFAAMVISFSANIITLVLCLGFVTFALFVSWNIIKQNPRRGHIASKYKLAICIVWFATFVLAFLFPEPLRFVSILWAASVSTLFTLVNLKAVGLDRRDNILLYLGSVLILASIPILLISGIPLSGYIVIIACSASLILAGFASNRSASWILQYAT